ncbi:MAG: diguanylate cyclase [Acinetobacter sp.]|uniref:GGDEF domain-containing protein n=1 Tax=Acinetobacter sp. TaxID=472 RepID=UPI0026E0CBC6|nr:diguanylate cyclase [Acinetobacter sp.]MDO5542208.1 diguanylate cyclase [Acinetobacter sp.]
MYDAQHSQASDITPAQALLNSASHSAKKSILTAADYDIKSRELIEQALKDPVLKIPEPFKENYYLFQYQNQKNYLQQVNYIAQLAFLIYFWADRFVLPDVEVLSGMLRVIGIVLSFCLNYFLFKYIRDIRWLDLILPISTCFSAILWFEILVRSNSEWVSTYLYASVIMIVLGNLSIQVHFLRSLITSAMISTAILYGVYRLTNLQDFYIYLLVYVPILLFSIYICWINTLKARKNFLRALLEDWNYHVLREMAQTDELTQLNNRRQFMHAVQQKMHASPRQTDTSLLIFDVDRFKVINDTYGHDVGDLVLRSIADISRSVMRHSDVLARFGGEEFIVFLPQTKKADALTIAERLRQKLEQHVIHLQDKQVQFSVSVGVSQLEVGQTDLEHLIKNADLALYDAKRLGRNRVVHFDDVT